MFQKFTFTTHSLLTFIKPFIYIYRFDVVLILGFVLFFVFLFVCFLLSVSVCLFSEKDRVIQVNAVAMDGAVHTFAVQTLRKCGKVAKVVSRLDYIRLNSFFFIDPTLG